jgi:hypothetical protein
MVVTVVADVVRGYLEMRAQQSQLVWPAVTSSPMSTNHLVT